MGLYRAVARPLLFALPPETGHRAAGALLTLPLPWSRIGGVPSDPALRTSLAGIELRNPIGLAAGFDKECSHLEALGRLGFGYVVGGTVTRAPRRGNAKPRIVRDSSTGAIVNSMGLPNPGADAAAQALRRSERTAPRFVSLADESLEDVLPAFGVLEPLVDGFELNASSPNAGWAHEQAHVGLLVRELRARTGKPIFVKLPRFESNEDREGVLGMALEAVEGGASGLTCSNTRPVQDSRLAVGRGGLSGRPLSGRTPEIVREILDATGGGFPVNACGGISTADDARACLDAGASTVQLYTGLVFEGPRIVGRMARGLSALGLDISPEEAR